MTEEIAVVGAGNMGSALAQVAANNGHHVRLWSIEHDVLEDVRDRRLNTKYLDDVKLHENITAVWELSEAVKDARLVILSVPSQVVRSVSKEQFEFIKPGQLVLNVAKGLEADTHVRMSNVITQELGRACAPYVGSMGGPAIAIEMARGGPLAVIIGFDDPLACRSVQALLQNHHLKVETTSDVAGLELSAMLKNVYAISLGICDGVGRGTNTKAFFATLALEEMAAISEALGGRAAHGARAGRRRRPADHGVQRTQPQPHARRQARRQGRLAGLHPRPHRRGRYRLPGDQGARRRQASPPAAVGDDPRRPLRRCAGSTGPANVPD